MKTSEGGRRCCVPPTVPLGPYSSPYSARSTPSEPMHNARKGRRRSAKRLKGSAVSLSVRCEYISRCERGNVRRARRSRHARLASREPRRTDHLANNISKQTMRPRSGGLKRRPATARRAARVSCDSVSVTGLPARRAGARRGVGRGRRTRDGTVCLCECRVWSSTVCQCYQRGVLYPRTRHTHVHREIQPDTHRHSH